MIFVCGQIELGNICPTCERTLGGPAEVEHRDRYGVRCCSEDCLADYQERRARNHADAHYGTRDMLCDCAEYCAPRGLPTQAERDEYAAYLASIKGTPLDPGSGPQHVIE